MNGQQVVIQILINSSGAQQTQQLINQMLSNIVARSRETAQQSALSFESIFGGNFFANLAADIVRNFAAGLRALTSEAIAESSKLESAFAGLRGISRNIGLNPADVTGAVQGLELVRSGLLTVGDAATAVKNLLATGFSLEQSIDLIKRFGDVAAFGRQASLTFGYAISSATEGVKNQNSILVDNIGLTKNLSVIMQERGFQLQDLSDKLKGAAAREALYSGLVKESQIQHGDAAKLLDTYQGKVVQLDTAWARFLAKMGDVITQNALVRASLSALVSVLDFMGRNANVILALATAFTLLTVAIIAMNTAQLAALPIIRQVIESVVLLGKVMTGTASLAAGSAKTMATAFLGYIGIGILLGNVLYNIINSFKSSTSSAQGFTVATTEQTTSLIKNRDALIQQSKALDAATNNSMRSAQDAAVFHKTLANTYSALTDAQQMHVDMTAREEGQYRAVNREVERIIDLKKEELRIDAASVQAALVGKAQDIQRNEARIDLLTNEIKLLERLNELRAAGSSSPEAVAGRAKLISDNPALRNGIQTLAPDVSSQFDVANWKFANASAAEYSEQIIKLRNEQAKLREETNLLTGDASKLNAQSIALREALGATTEQVTQQAASLGFLQGDTSAAIALATDFANRERLKQAALNAATDAIHEQINALSELTDAEARMTQRNKALSTLKADIAEFAPAGKAKEILADRVKNDPEVRRIVEDSQRVTKSMRDLDEAINPREKRAHKERHRETELESLTKKVNSLTEAVESFANLSSREFELRFKAENLERQKRDLEKILDLRRELQLQDVKAALPRTAEAARLEIDSLESQLRVRDSVRSALNEERDAVEKLAVLQRTVEIPAVNAGTLAQIRYLDAVRSRAREEQDLTARLITEQRLRKEALEDEVGSTKRAYQSLRLSLIEDLNKLDDELAQQKVLSRILQGGELDVEAEISHRVKIDAPKVPNELQRVATATETIQQSVSRIESAMTSSNSSSASYTSKSYSVGISHPRAGVTRFVPENYQSFNLQERLGEVQDILADLGLTSQMRALGQGNIHNKWGYDHRNSVDIAAGPNSSKGRQLQAALIAAGIPFQSFDRAIPGVSQGAHTHLGLPSQKTSERYRVGTLLDVDERAQAHASAQTTSSSTSTVFSLLTQGKDLLVSGINAAIALVRGEDDVAANAVTGSTTRVGKSTLDLITEKSAKQSEKDRVEANNLATIEIAANEGKLGHQLIEIENDVNLQRSRLNLEREREARQTAVNIRLLNEDIAAIDSGNQEALTRLYSNAEEARLRSRIDMRQSIVTMNDEIAHSGEDAALREQAAYLEAVLEIKHAHEDAAASIIKSQVKIADATIYHSDIANAKVLDFLAQQKSVTDIVADAKTGAIQATYDFIDRGLDRVTSKLGSVGNLLKDIIGNLIKLSLNSVFARLFGGASTSQQNGGILNVFSSLASSRAQASTSSQANALSSFLTGGFAGGNPGQSILSNGGGNFFSASGQQSQAASLAARIFGNSTSGSSNIGFLPTVTGEAANASQIATILHEAGHTGATVGTTAATTSSTAGLAAALPLLGLTAGASLGGSFFQDSRAANAIGTVAGGALGLSAGLAGFLALGGSLGTGALASVGTAIAGALPIIAPIAIAALVASYFINRSAARRKAEVQRTAILGDAKSKLQQILAAVKRTGSGSMDAATAVAQSLEVRQQYLDETSKITDSKTRRIAQDTVRELDVLIAQIKTAAAKKDASEELDRTLIPTFKDGGSLMNSITLSHEYAARRMSDGGIFVGPGRVSVGGDTSIDRHPALLADDETVINSRHRAALGGDAAMRRAGVPGYAGGRPAQTASQAAAQAQQMPRIVALLVTNDVADELESMSNGEVTYQKVRAKARRDGSDGLFGDFLMSD
jgi:hypothetical protein